MDDSNDLGNNASEGSRRHSLNAHVPEGQLEDGADQGLGDPPSRSSSSAQSSTGSPNIPADRGPPAPNSSPTAPRVRFSQDIDRGASLDISYASVPKNPIPEHGGTSSGDRTVGEGRAPPGRLSMGGPNYAGDENGLPGRHPAARSSPSPLSARPGGSPGMSEAQGASPTKRNRGYSLRRALFARGVQNQDATSNLENAFQLEEQNADRTSTTDDDARMRPTRDGDKAGDHIQPRSSPVADAHVMPQKGVALPNYESWHRQRAARARLVRAVRDTFSQARKIILRIQEIQPTDDGRHLDLDASRLKCLTDERTGRPYISNVIRSSRYTVWTFLPRQLFAQFSKLANFYFLCVSILQMIPSLSTTGTYTTIIPLLFFVALSMAKEGYDDYRRYRLDKIENRRSTRVFRNEQAQDTVGKQVRQPLPPSIASPQWKTIKWEDVEVGDVVELERDDAVPADLALLHATGPNNVAYVETMALDGETALKSKQTLRALTEQCVDEAGLTRCAAHFVVEDPNLDLYSFEGRVTVSGDTQPLTNNEVVYRGSVLRNTERAYGMVIYSGEECKIRMNASKNPRIKAPALQAKVNRVVIIIVIFVVALAVFNTSAYQIWSNSHEDKSWYLTNASVAFFPIFASFIIMFNTLIPLSLYVSLEIIKLAQIFLMNDIDMYDEVSDTPMEPRTSTINEELGQVSYIFSDKTGTLTDNSMRLRKLSIAGIAWLHDFDLQDEATKGAQQEMLRHKKRKAKRAEKGKQPASDGLSVIRQSDASGRKSQVGVAKPDTLAADSPPSAWKSPAKPARPQPKLRTAALLSYLAQKPRTVFARKARFFLLSIALCHTCLPEAREDGTYGYQAISPDEVALVQAAQELGYVVMDRQAHTVTLKLSPAALDGEPIEEVYEVLDVIEFSSDRKRMSVVARFPNRRICIICKGADSTVMQLLRMASLATEKAVEVERKANFRKSMEAQEVIRRTSEQTSRRDSLHRPSMSAARPSIGGAARPSLNLNRLRPIADEIDDWLTSRERDVDFSSSVDDESVYCTPRPSAHFRPRRSSIGFEPRASLQSDAVDDLLFDEAAILDDSLVFERCFQHINDFATEGLRTLLYGFRYVSEQEYATWKKIYSDATTSLVDRQAMVEQAGELIERDFELAGVTAIEDQLQKGVPETIDKLRRARIKLWMLTGDKRETAINIGHSCRLIKDYSSITVLDEALGDVDQNMAAALIECTGGKVAHSVVVIDGKSLSVVEGRETSWSLFLGLAVVVDTVICCRASPSQKASLVKAIRKKVKDSVTLAIGDGANDIAMIQEAHVGIGITGKEGLQAARTSDYSIAQFRFLLKLLLVHGRWNYVRTCKYTLATFWKETVFYLTQALYQRWVGYTGTSLYEQWSLSMFNTLFTSLPVIFLGVFEKDMAASTLLAVPELYARGQRAAAFNIKVYLGWVFMAASEAMIIFFVMLGLYGDIRFTNDNGLYAMGVLTYSASVILISTKLQILEMHNKSIMAAISFVASVGGWFLWNIMLSLVYRVDPIYAVKGRFLHRFGQNPLWWLVLILVILCCVVFEVGVASLRAALFPTDVDHFQEYERDLQARKRFEEAASSELQQGWNHGHERTSAEMQREKEIQDLLDRPRVMEEGRRMTTTTATTATTTSQNMRQHARQRRRSSTAAASEPSSPIVTGGGGGGGFDDDNGGDGGRSNGGGGGDSGGGGGGGNGGSSGSNSGNGNGNGNGNGSGSGNGNAGGNGGGGDSSDRRSMDIQDMLARRFGSIKRSAPAQIQH